MLWKQLRAGSMKNYTFNRQKPLGCYIVDFYCKPLKLVIEIDGSYHLDPAQKIMDSSRQMILEKMGHNFLRFTEQQAREDLPLVLKTIKNYIENFRNQKGN